MTLEPLAEVLASVSAGEAAEQSSPTASQFTIWAYRPARSKAPQVRMSGTPPGRSLTRTSLRLRVCQPQGPLDRREAALQVRKLNAIKEHRAR